MALLTFHHSAQHTIFNVAQDDNNVCSVSVCELPKTYCHHSIDPGVILEYGREKHTFSISNFSLFRHLEECYIGERCICSMPGLKMRFLFMNQDETEPILRDESFTHRLR